MKLSWLLGSAALIALVGCGVTPTQMGKPSTSSVASKALDTFFPTQAGYTWQYNVAVHPTEDPDESIAGTQTFRIDSSRKRGDGSTISLRESDSYTMTDRFPTIILTQDKLVVQGVDYLGPLATVTPDLKSDFLRFPLVTGKKWDDGNWLGELKGQEKVTVPAGTFEAWKMSIIGTYDHAYTAVGTYWLAPEVGIVKSDLFVEGFNLESELKQSGLQKR